MTPLPVIFIFSRRDYSRTESEVIGSLALPEDVIHSASTESAIMPLARIIFFEDEQEVLSSLVSAKHV